DEEVTFTTSVRMKALTAEELFDEYGTGEHPGEVVDPHVVPTTVPPSPDASPPSAASPPPAPPAAPAAPPPPAAAAPPPLPPTPTPEHTPPPEMVTPSLDLGRGAMAEGHWREACQIFAAILRSDPRNRQVRALYHVANGMELRSKGEGARALLQFETALAH